jgi:hypothetical protein
MTDSEYLHQKNLERERAEAKGTEPRLTIGKVWVEENAITRIGALVFIRRREAHHELAAERFKGLYEARYGAGKRAITAALANLTAPIDRDEVDRIIGNKSWTECCCDLCGENRETLIRVGDEADYEARWLDICPLCVSKLNDFAARLTPTP